MGDEDTVWKIENKQHPYHVLRLLFVNDIIEDSSRSYSWLEYIKKSKREFPGSVRWDNTGGPSASQRERTIEEEEKEEEEEEGDASHGVGFGLTMKAKDWGEKLDRATRQWRGGVEEGERTWFFPPVISWSNSRDRINIHYASKRPSSH